MNTDLIIDRFEEDLAVLLTNDKQIINWPKNLLPPDAKEGSVINFSLLLDGKKTDDKKDLAKQILNEILGGE
jgi:hypothetical protein